MNATAHVGHAMRGRTRFKIPSMRGDHAYFARLEQLLKDRPGIRHLRSNVRTGSILVEHAADLELSDIVGYGESAQGFRLARSRRPEATAVQTGAETLKSLDARLRRSSDGGTDLRSLMLFGLLLLGVAQLVRGQILGPAFAYFWYAFQLMGGPPDFEGPE